jgi:polysaccharide biosynthesis transport protein
MMYNFPLTADPGQSIEDGLSARALLSYIRRHWALVLVLAMLGSAAGMVAGLGLPTWYKAEGVLVIPAVPQRMAELQELPDASPDQDALASEVDILQSRSVIEPVVRSLKLWQAPEFQPTEYPDGWTWQRAEAALGAMWRNFWGITDEPADGPREPTPTSTGIANGQVLSQAQIDDLVGAYVGYLAVANDGHSMTLHISYRALTRERAAEIVNAHLESYRNFQVKTKVAAAEHANGALRSQVAELRPQLSLADAAVTRYRAEHGLTGAAEDRAGMSAQLAGLNTELITARADLASSQAHLAEINAGTGSETLPEVVGSGTIGGLRGQEAQLLAHEADLGKYHGDQYPDLQRVRASLQSVRSQISRQTGRERAAALQLVQRARTREVSIERSVAALTAQLNSADVGLEQLQGKAESIRSLLLNFEKRIAETAADPALITPNSIIASRANASATSASSKTKPLTLVGGFVGFTLGSLLSLLLELRERGFRTSAQVQQHIGSLSVSATPRAVGRRRKFPADIILDDPRSGFAEAFRVSWANIQHALEGPRSAVSGSKGPGSALALTSASTGEGKSVHALALARTAALGGEDVVLVDADLRRSGVSRLLGRHFRFTLRDFLDGRCAAEDVIVVEERSGAHFVPSLPTERAWTTHDLRRFFNLVHHLKQRFAVVIIDLPPVMGLAETVRLVRAADSSVLIVRWGRTERQSVQCALEALRGASVSTIAVILNDVDLKALRRRGYRDRNAVYLDKNLYRVAPPPQVAAASPASAPPAPSWMADAKSDAAFESSLPEAQRDEAVVAREQPHSTGSAITRWYDQYHG